MNKKELARLIYECVKDSDDNKETYRINEIIRLIDASRVRRTQIKIPIIYVITTLRFGYKYANMKRSGDGKYHSFEKRTSPSQRKYFTITRGRTWGWYKSLKDAQECVKQNWGDIYEGEYSYAVIEKISEGVLHGMDIPVEWWYKWHGSWQRGKFKEWKKPDENLGINLIKEAIFGKYSGKYSIDFERMINSGRIPTSLPWNYRKKLEKLGIISKKSRGVYLTTESFKKVISRLSEAQTIE